MIWETGAQAYSRDHLRCGPCSVSLLCLFGVGVPAGSAAMDLPTEALRVDFRFADSEDTTEIITLVSV